MIRIVGLHIWRGVAGLCAREFGGGALGGASVAMRQNRVWRFLAVVSFEAVDGGLHELVFGSGGVAITFELDSVGDFVFLVEKFEAEVLMKAGAEGSLFGGRFDSGGWCGGGRGRAED